MKKEYISPDVFMLKIGMENIMNVSRELTFSESGEGDAYSYADYFLNKL